MNASGASRIAGIAACALGAWLALADSQADRSPVPGPRSSAQARSAAAAREVELALRAFGDPSRPAGERLAAYDAGLARAERHWIEALRIRPTVRGALTDLAGVRLERANVAGHPPPSVEGWVAGAERLAPRSAASRLAIANLYLDGGDRARASEFYRRSVELDPERRADVIEGLRARGFRADEVAAALPGTPEDWVALAALYHAEDGEARLIGAITPLLTRTPHVPLLSTWATAHRRIGRFAELETGLEQLGDGDAPWEARRALELSRARLRLARFDEAMRDAARAHTLDPTDLVIAENVGIVALAAGRGEDAAQAYGRALSLARDRNVDARARARLYAGKGSGEQKMLRFDAARDAYERALQLDPSQPAARRGLAQIAPPSS